MAHRTTDGFTLVELMIVVVVIGILAAVAVPNLISIQDRAREAAVKSNCRTVSMAAEDFAIVSGGIYPNAIAPLMPFLPAGSLLRNPFTRADTEPQLGNVPNAGEVRYEPTVNAGITDGYIIRGGGNGGAVIVIVLTNGTVI